MRKLVKKIMRFIDGILRAVCRIFPRSFREGVVVRFHRLWTYCFFGCINTAIDFGVFSLLKLVLHVPVGIAQAAGLLCGSSNGYLLNSTITFGEGRGRTKGQYFQYVGVDVVLAVLTGAFMQWAETHVPLPAIVMKIPVTAVATVIHYIVYKKVVFRIRKDERSE
jgi:putative flippase GtrA